MGNLCSKTQQPPARTWPNIDLEGVYHSLKVNGVWINGWAADKPSFITSAASIYASLDDDVDSCCAARNDDDLNQNLKVRMPYWMEHDNAREVGAPGVRATWIGHSTVLVEVDGTILLCDPIFSQRASAVQWIGPKRFRPPACQVHELPGNLS